MEQLELDVQPEEITFSAWPKIPRLRRDIVITEKIDGTNAAVRIFTAGPGYSEDYVSGSTVPDFPHVFCATVDDVDYYVVAQGRKRMLSTETKATDNFGFARWVHGNAETLIRGLGIGTHYGEWYGSKIQSGYGYVDGERKFMLFNASRWTPETITDDLTAIGVESPTVLYQGVFDVSEINYWIEYMKLAGSVHVPGQKPEGIVIYHVASNNLFKVLCENDELPKGVRDAVTA